MAPSCSIPTIQENGDGSLKKEEAAKRKSDTSVAPIPQATTTSPAPPKTASGGNCDNLTPTFIANKVDSPNLDIPLGFEGQRFQANILMQTLNENVDSKDDYMEGIDGEEDLPQKSHHVRKQPICTNSATRSANLDTEIIAPNLALRNVEGLNRDEIFQAQLLEIDRGLSKFDPLGSELGNISKTDFSNTIVAETKLGHFTLTHAISSPSHAVRTPLKQILVSPNSSISSSSKLEKTVPKRKKNST